MLASLILILFSHSTFAEPLKTEAEIPIQITEFMSQFRQEKITKASELIMWEWLDKAQQAKQMQDADKTNRLSYGKMVGYEVLKACKTGKFLYRTQAIAKYERGFVHWFFEYYNPGNGWKLNNYKFNNKDFEPLECKG
jgi:hypothetical protein